MTNSWHRKKKVGQTLWTKPNEDHTKLPRASQGFCTRLSGLLSGPSCVYISVSAAHIFGFESFSAQQSLRDMSLSGTSSGDTNGAWYGYNAQDNPAFLSQDTQLIRASFRRSLALSIRPTSGMTSCSWTPRNGLLVVNFQSRMQAINNRLGATLRLPSGR